MLTSARRDSLTNSMPDGSIRKYRFARPPRSGVGSAIRDDPPVAQRYDPFRTVDDIELVADDDRQAPFEAIQQGEKGIPVAAVEALGGFVENDERRAPHKYTRGRQSLLFAPAQKERVPVEEMIDAQLF